MHKEYVRQIHLLFRFRVCCDLGIVCHPEASPGITIGMRRLRWCKF